MQNSTCQGHLCPGCGFPLIHQANRGPRESSSALGQHISDRLSRGGWSFTDVDGIGWRGKTIRVFEHKWEHSAEMKTGQRGVLRQLSRWIQHAVDTSTLSAQSGVFVITSELDAVDPTNFSSARVVKLAQHADNDVEFHMNRRQLDALLECRDVSDPGSQQLVLVAQ